MLKPLLFILLVGVGGIVHTFDVTTMKLKSNCVSKMEKQGVVPDVVDVVPRNVVKLTYKSGVSANLGNVLTPTQVKDMPNVTYEADSSKFYTLVMTDPDAPSRANPTDREFHHWLVGNIPGNNLTSGETLTEYIGSGPPQGSGLHRYVFLVFKQKSKLKFTEKIISNRSGENREKFSVRTFSTKYGLGNPVAGNFYQAEWDDYVPILYEQLGGN